MLSNVTRNEQQWDAFVLAHGGGFLQSWGWSQFQEAIGRRVYRVRLDSPQPKSGDDASSDLSSEASAKEEDATIVQFMMLELALPFGQRYVYVPRGPIVRAGTDVRASLSACIGTLRESMSRDGAAFARVEWPWDDAHAIASAEDFREWGFLAAGHMQPQHTVVADLRRSEDELLAAMHPKTRYNARLADKHGVTVRESVRHSAHQFREDIDTFWSLLSETAERDAFSTHEKKYYDRMIEVLSPKKSHMQTGSGPDGMAVRLVLAEREGRAIAAALIGEFGDTMTYLHGASKASERKFMAPYLLHWQIMREAKARGFSFYDFWGVAPDDSPAHAWAGITRFKTGFGGARVSYPGAWELPGKGIWYSLYRLAKRIRGR